MVHRRALSVAAAGCAALGAITVAIAAPPARADDAKVAIGHYRWNTPVVHVDLGQHVTWYWVGPDTMHSVTGDSPNDESTDSDPNTSEPEHKVGDHFQVTFSQPGVYQFHCKLHPTVHGEVIVSATPGNPAIDPDPTPKPNVELLHPQVTDVSLAPAGFGPTGTRLHFALNDSALLDAEIWHARNGHRGTYAGWEAWHGHIGFNEVNFAHHGPHLRHFTPRPGHYVAYLQATDPFHNVSGTRRLAFTIRAPRPRGTADRTPRATHAERRLSRRRDRAGRRSPTSTWPASRARWRAWSR